MAKVSVSASMPVSVAEAWAGSALSIDAEFSAPMLFGPLGSAVGRTLKGDLRASLANLVKLIER